MPDKPKSLIICSPYREPGSHWRAVEGGKKLEITQGRREAGYTVADPKAKPHQDIGRFVPLPMVNQIRARVGKWRGDNYPGVTGVTKTLLEHWHDKDQRRDYPFFFCQTEAIETLIWLVEAPDSDKAGIDIPSDGGDFRRLCCKLATGTGKTVVMAMLAAWQIANKAANPRDNRFSKNILVVAPGLTVRDRLQVLHPPGGKFYEEFGVLPHSLADKMRQGKINILNWHALAWESDEKIKQKKGVDKRGAKSDEAWLQSVLGEMAPERNIIVINDEAHHAWRKPPETARVKKDEQEQATKWLEGLDRIHRARGVLDCFDFSATPFVPGANIAEDGLFDWIVSDFGLNDAVESGLVKTPRIVVRDDAVPDAKTYKPRLYHIYNDADVKDDLNRKAQAAEPLPVLVTAAYTLLGKDWQKTKDEWQKGKTPAPTPPVMISVVNRIETAERVKFMFDKKHIPVGALCESEGILRIDTKELKKAETAAGAGTANKREAAEKLRGKLNTVGQQGEDGEKIQNVISVEMLSEGWDARTVTHIMGLRAFSSQLLCEQVIGRGLRRASYEVSEDTGMFEPEYVNVFGVPFSFLPHAESESSPPPPPPKQTIMPDAEKTAFALQWPNIVRIQRELSSELTLNAEKAEPLTLHAADTPQLAEIAPTVGGAPDISNINNIDLEDLRRDMRRQKVVFRAAADIWHNMKPGWHGSPETLIAQIIRIVDCFIASGKITVSPGLFNKGKDKLLVIMLNMPKVVRHIWGAIESKNTETLQPVFDEARPVRATGDMRPWRTGKPCEFARKSHINLCVYDSAWEASEAHELDRNKNVEAWAKNDHLGFEIVYIHGGAVHKYRPDFIARLRGGEMLALEVKGRETEQDKAKRRALQDWTNAVNNHGGFGAWSSAVSKTPGDIKDIIAARASG